MKRFGGVVWGVLVFLFSFIMKSGTNTWETPVLKFFTALPQEIDTMIPAFFAIGGLLLVPLWLIRCVANYSAAIESLFETIEQGCNEFSFAVEKTTNLTGQNLTNLTI